MSTAEKQPDVVRVLTWNIWWRFGPHWRDRQNGIVHTLRAADADVIALQEVWGTAETTQAHWLGKQLGRHAAFAEMAVPPPPDPPESPDQRGVLMGVGLLSRWPIRQTRHVALPAQHADPPVALHATLDHPRGALHVLASCLDWEPDDMADRLQQGRRLAALIADPALDGPLPVIVAGDLNATADSAVLAPLGAVATDAWLAAGGDPAAVTLPSIHPFAPVEAIEQIDQRIDHVFVRPGHAGQTLNARGAALLGDPVDGRHPSDHLAVTVDIGWRD